MIYSSTPPRTPHIAKLSRIGSKAAPQAALLARPVRAWIYQVIWCLITRHRLRTCFSEFIITNRTGSLPLILWARPTPVLLSRFVTVAEPATSAEQEPFLYVAT
jgi:hypothetical protein